MRMRFERWAMLLACAALCTAPAAAHAQPQAPAPAPAAAPEPAASRDETDAAIDRALGYLASQQQQSGCIGQTGNGIALTSLSLLAFAAAGHQLSDPTPQGLCMRRALQYVIQPQFQDPQGFFGNADGSVMYGHGVATLMLSEMLGMAENEQQEQIIRQRLRKAIDLILRAQAVRKEARHQGGWRYKPDSGDADLSITVWQLLALRAAKNAGMDVPQEAIESAAAYVRRSYASPVSPEGKPTNMETAFGYQVGSGPAYACATAGMLSLQLCGYYKDPTVEGTANWLGKISPQYNDSWFFYGTYYYAQCTYQFGGPLAQQGRQRVRDLLLPKQKSDGSWEAGDGAERHAGPIYTTSLAVLSLAVKYHYLPIYQR